MLHTQHHDIHSSQLRPDLCEHSNMGTLDHIWLKELEKSNIGIVSLKLAHVLNLLQFDLNKGIVWIAATVNKCENSMAILPSVLSCKPTRRFWQPEETEEQENGRKHLQAPGNSEGSNSIDVAAAIRDVEHDHNTPSDCPLLGTHHTSTLTRLRKLRDVDGDLSRANTDGETIDEAAHNEHADVLGGADNN